MDSPYWRKRIEREYKEKQQKEKAEKIHLSNLKSSSNYGKVTK